MADKKIGKVVHFYDKIGVAIIELSGPLKQGDSLKIKGKTADFTQLADSLEIEHQKIKSAKKGDSIGLKVEKDVKEGDLLYKI